MMKLMRCLNKDAIRLYNKCFEHGYRMSEDVGGKEEEVRSMNVRVIVGVQASSRTVRFTIPNGSFGHDPGTGHWDHSPE